MSGAGFILPRFLRMRDAPRYLGMCPRTFNTEVRPHVREFRIGKQGIGFDRKDLDVWADQYVKNATSEENNGCADNQGSGKDSPG